MNSPAAASLRKTVVVGTGGTIAGRAARADDVVGYAAGAIDAAELVAALPPLVGVALDVETLARLDSADMDHATWARLRERVAHHLTREDVGGVVVTHGTDTLEETAYFLHRTVDASAKPVVLTAAMRPATALSADGPQNLVDAVTVARCGTARGVVAVLAGRVHAASRVRKLHSFDVDAFASGDAGVVARIDAGRVREFGPWPRADVHRAAARLPPAVEWPAVDVVVGHAGVRGAVVDAVVAAGARGLVIAGTGNGQLHRDLAAAARRAAAAGVVVRRASRCAFGGVVEGEGDGDGDEAAAERGPSSAGALTAYQARIELLLDLIATGR